MSESQSQLPDYSLHEGVYRSLRAKGAPGWSSDEEYAEMLRLVSPALPPVGSDVAPPRVLELGCGAGNFSTILAGKGYEVTGVDISATGVAWATERVGQANAKFRVDDVVHLSTFEAASFDVVVDGHCLHCIVGDDRAECLNSVLRVLKPGGTFVVLTMCGDVVDERLLKSFDPATRIVSFGGRPTRYIGTDKGIVEEVARAGFEILSSSVGPRKQPGEQDDLVIHARKP